ncbi:MAG TPA: phosphopantetheine-binding protein [Acidimicrobiales bacterium]|nr:phosphopantetheine-binding protein [Acidimicrobiales bacterium]
MTNEEARQLIRSVLHQVAPEADMDDVGEGETLQEALDLDSIDFLNFVIGLNEETGLEIPERDYPQLSTVGGCVTYLTSAR